MALQRPNAPDDPLLTTQEMWNELGWGAPEPRRDLLAIGRPAAERIRQALESRLLPDPRRGEPLRGPGKPLWKFGVGDDRILYAFNDAGVWVLVVRVAHCAKACCGLRGCTDRRCRPEPRVHEAPCR